ncbi:MAG: PASTA domain-containing protein [Gemmatimonadota bacterium]
MRFRRHTESGLTAAGQSFLATMRGRRTVKQIGILVGAFLAGYLVTVFFIYPTPLFSADKAVPRVLDEDGAEGRTRLEAQGFKGRIDGEEPHPRTPKGAVVWQDPAPGTTLPAGTTVHLTTSSGPASVPVPDVVAFDASLARRVLLAAGFAVAGIDSIPASSDPGTVVATRPSSGIVRDAGAGVGLVLSGGPAEISVPDLFGMTKEQAIDRLDQTGLTSVETQNRMVTSGPAGRVVEQRPASGNLVRRGTRVTLFLSKKP